MISDFGLSKTEESGAMATACGTPGYVGMCQHLSCCLKFCQYEYSCVVILEMLFLFLVEWDGVLCCGKKSLSVQITYTSAILPKANKKY